MRPEDVRGRLWKDSPSFYKLLIPNTVAGHRFRQVRMANYGQFIAVALAMVTTVLFINYRILNSRLSEEQLTHQLTKRNFEATVEDQLSKIRDLQAEDERSRSTIESLKSQLDESTASVSRLKSQLEEKSAQYEDSVTQIKQLSDSLESSSIRNDDSTKEIIGLQNLVENLKDNETNLIGAIEEDQRQMLDLQEQILTIGGGKDILIKENEDLKATVDTLKKDNSNMKNDLQNSIGERDVLNKENVDLKSQLQNIHDKAEALGTQKEEVVEPAQMGVIAAPAPNQPSDTVQEVKSPVEDSQVIAEPKVPERPEDKPLELPQLPHAGERDSNLPVNHVPGIRIVRDADETNQLGVANEHYNHDQYVDDPEEEQDEQDNEQQVEHYKEDQAVDHDREQEGEQDGEQDEEPDYGPVKRDFNDEN
ncbi:unnamed protein product [Meganyctiphanes norvegica]|uniref:Uncharacterized protein n=1 Tax=Meganyctiphanes norvegica TaxID=48144 RepID=A0AAV2PWE1_MEGNR